MYTTFFPYLLGAILAWITVRPLRKLSPSSVICAMVKPDGRMSVPEGTGPGVIAPPPLIGG